MSRMLSFVVLVLFLVAIGIIFFRVVSGFLIPAFLAALLSVIFFPIHNRVTQRLPKLSRYLTAAITTFIVAIIVLTPAALIIALSALEGMTIVHQISDVGFRKRWISMQEQLDLEIPHREDLLKIERTLERLSRAVQAGQTAEIDAETLKNLSDRAKRLTEFVKEHPDQVSVLEPASLEESLAIIQNVPPNSLEFDDYLSEARSAFRRFKLAFLGGPYRAWVKELLNPTDAQLEALRSSLFSTQSPLLDLGGDTISIFGRLLFGAVIMLATLYFLFADGARLRDEIISFSPLEEKYVRELLLEFERASRAIVLATLLSAIAQGVVAGIGYQVAGVGSVFLLTLLTGMLAMVPFLGAASVWIVVCLWIYAYEGRSSVAVGLAVYGTVIISGVDNIIKPLVLHGQSNLHPLLALLSILGGVQTMGPIGILIGPMSVVFLQTLVRILHREYKIFEGRMESGQYPAAEPIESDEMDDNE